MEHKEYKVVGKAFRKKDSMQLLTGKPVYVDDITPGNALVVKILRSPHANAIVQEINTDTAKKFPVLWISTHGRMFLRHDLPLQARHIPNHPLMTG